MSDFKKFWSEPGFCPHCGSILPFPKDIDRYTFCRCGYKMKCEEWNDMVLTEAVVVLNEIKENVPIKQEDTKDSGPVIERLCAKCGHNQMTYKTQQLRSVDEGMSIFYYCLKCNSIEKEDS